MERAVPAVIALLFAVTASAQRLPPVGSQIGNSNEAMALQSGCAMRWNPSTRSLECARQTVCVDSALSPAESKKITVTWRDHYAKASDYRVSAVTVENRGTCHSTSTPCTTALDCNAGVACDAPVPPEIGPRFLSVVAPHTTTTASVVIYNADGSNTRNARTCIEAAR